MIETVMKITARNLLILFVFSVASAVYGAAPSVNITVKQKPGGKIVKQLKTDSGGNFAIGSLAPGAYTLEFRAQQSTDVKNKQFSIAVGGTKASGKQSVAGNSLVGGVALNVEVGPAANVTGQVAAGPNAAQKKQMVWIPAMLGSNMPGHWVEKGSAEEIASRNRGIIRKESIQGLQEKARGAGNGG
jgi:hypothetical protein